MGNRDGYYQEYYGEKADEIAEKRKDRYATDPRYRQSVIDRSKAYRDRQRSGPKVAVPRWSKPKVREAGDGGKVELYSIGAFALAIGRSIQCVNHWERPDPKTGREELLPKTPYRQGERGFRFYTKAMAMAVRDFIGEHGRLHPIPKGMFKEIEKRWRDLGVPVDCDGGLEEALRLTRTKA